MTAITLAAPLDEPALARAVRTLARAEPRFAHIVKRHGPPPLWPREPGFETLVLLMLEQQVSLAQARAMYARIATASGTLTPANVAGLGESGLRALGVTRQKSAYLAALATQLERNELDLDALVTLPDVDAAAALDAVHGVGPWTAQCYLLFALRRSDVFPSADLALMEAVRELWRLRARPSPEALARYRSPVPRLGSTPTCCEAVASRANGLGAARSVDDPRAFFVGTTGGRYA